MDREMLNVKLTEIVDDAFQMRATMEPEALRELVDSIRRDGVLCPVLLRCDGDKYSVIAGHRRVAAANQAELETIPALIQGAGEQSGWGHAFAENMFRADISPIEEAAGITDWIAQGKGSIDTVASALGRSVGWVKDRLALLQWPKDVLTVLQHGGLSLAALRPLAAIEDESHRVMLLDYAIENGASARTTAAWFQAWRVGESAREPGDIEVAEPGEAPRAVEVHTPCVVCSKMEKIANVRHLPICPVCQDLLVDAVKAARNVGSEVAVGDAGG